MAGPPSAAKPPAPVGAGTARDPAVPTAFQPGLPASHRAADARPDWWRTGAIYQIYPRSFADSNGDGVGDLPGIIDRLDHLGGSPDSLGIDAIWLSPIYPSPDFDFGYDVADYTGIHPSFGTLDDFERLVAGAHSRGMRVILDLVLNHTSYRHAWFEASRTSRDGEFADWYIWRDSPGRDWLGRRRRPNNWRSFFGGSAWTWDATREQFYLHTFLPEQPDLNWRHAPVREAVHEVIRTWLDRGVDGFRLDVFNTYYKDATFRSNPGTVGRRGAWSWQRHQYDRNQPELKESLAELRALLDARPGRMTVGELFDGTVAEAAAFVAPGHLVFDWTLMHLPWRAEAFRSAIARRDAIYGPDRWPANVLSNHDQPRHASRYDFGDGLGDARACLAATLLLTLRGTPFLYYGEEIGLRGLRIPNRLAADPPARRANMFFPWWNRDQARGPMPWNDGPGGGFTSGSPWLPLPPDFGDRNVEEEAGQPDSVFATYRRLLALRRATPALRDGDQQLLDLGDKDVLAYEREAGSSARVVVALNFARAPAAIVLPRAVPGRSWRLALSTGGRADGRIDARLVLGPLEAIVAIEG